MRLAEDGESGEEPCFFESAMSQDTYRDRLAQVGESTVTAAMLRFLVSETMRCPKCGFDGGDERQCARCGVVFSKLRADRPAPRPRPTTSAAPPLRTTSAAPARPALLSRGFKWTLAFLATILASALAFVASLPPSPSEYGLPPLDVATVSAESVRHAKQVASEHPDVPVLKEYAGHAQLLLALRFANERRFPDAEAALDEAPRAGAPLSETAAFRAFVLRNQGLWDEASRSAAQALELGARTSPSELHHIIGRARYYREDLPGAIDELDKALAIEDRPAIRSSLEAARRDLEIAGSFARLEIPHFVVRYDASTMGAPSRLAVETLEDGYQALVSRMGFSPRERIAVVLYTREDYLAVGGDREATGLFDGKIRVSLADIESKESWVTDTLVHELAHAFVRSRVVNQLPRWLNEGIAEYVVGARMEDFTARLETPFEKGSLARCVIEDACERAAFYRASGALVDYLVEFRGMVGIRDVLDYRHRGQSIDDALERVFGDDERGLALEWERYIERRLR